MQQQQQHGEGGGKWHVFFHLRCETRDGMFSQACLIHRVRFYLPHHFPPSCAYTLLHFAVIFPGPRVSSHEKGGRSDNENRYLRNRAPPHPATDALVGTPARRTILLCVRVCFVFGPQQVAYDRPSPSSHWIGRIDRRARAPPPPAGRKDLAANDDLLSFSSFFTLPLVAWCSVCVCVCMYV